TKVRLEAASAGIKPSATASARAGMASAVLCMVSALMLPLVQRDRRRRGVGGVAVDRVVAIALDGAAAGYAERRLVAGPAAGSAPHGRPRARHDPGAVARDGRVLHRESTAAGQHSVLRAVRDRAVAQGDIDHDAVGAEEVGRFEADEAAVEYDVLE